MSGFNLPPGCSTRMIEDQFADRPCEICHRFPDQCICPECPTCGVQGDPKCLLEHGIAAAQAERIKALEEGLEAIERNADRRYKDLTHDDLHGFADIHCRYRDAARALLEKP